MKYKILISSVLALFTFHLIAQDHADCNTALKLEGNSIVVKSVDGPGKVLEIKGFELGNKQYFTEEHNTVWISYTVTNPGDLSFDIIPEKEIDDWDFMVFKVNGTNCADIPSQRIKPVRSNLARNDANLKGRTGLSKDALESFQPAGVNPNYCKSISVHKDEVYMIAVDINKSSGAGFTLNINLDVLEEITTEHNIDEAAASGFDFVDMTDEPEPSNEINVKFQIFKEGTNEPMACHGEVIGVQWSPDDLVFTNKTEYEFKVPKDKWFYFNIRKEGYTFSSEKYKATDELHDFPQKIYINEVKTGEHIILKEIVFRENTTQLLPTSINALEQLIAFMNEYPNAKIEIQGHVNAPGFDNDGKVRKVSLKRAEQIKQFLVDSEIDGRRIEVKGMGNEFMIYPSPSNYEEEKANRRVEIEILSL